MLSALKRLLRHPGYFLTLVLVMATGLGGALSLYGISDAVLFRPLNVENAQTLVRIFRSDEKAASRDNWSVPGARDYLGSSEAFEGVAWYAEWLRVAHTSPGMSKIMLNSALVSGNFFALLDVHPARGRLLQPNDDVRGSAIAGVLSFETWQSRFNSAPDIVGNAITLGGEPVTIVGIASPGFTGVSLTTRPDVWLPVNSATHMALPAMPTEQFLTSENMSWLSAVARLAPGVSLEQARASLETARLADGEEGASPHALVFRARNVAIDPSGKRNIETVSWILFGLVAVLLVIVCADAAGLMLVRAEAARSETGIRLSLGATRARVARDVLGEAAIIVAAAALLALLFALLLSGWLQRNIGAELALPEETGALIFNSRVLLAFAGMLLIAALLSSLAPIRRLGATRLADVLRGARHGDSGRAVNARDGLIVVQVGMSVLLLTVSMMFIGALRETLAVDPGIQTQGRAVAFVNLTGTDRERPDYLAVLQALRDDPRVTHSAVASNVPVSQSGTRRTVQPQDYSPAPGEDMQVEISFVSDGYFDALGISILRGHDFRGPIAGEIPEDVQRRVIVNEAFAERYWPGRNPVGLLIHYGIDEIAEVIAVVANNKQHDLREAPRPMMFITFQQSWVSAVNIVAAAHDADIAMNAIRDAVAKTGSRVSIQGIGSLQGRIDRLTQRDRAVTLLAIGAAVFATLLAVVGMYGVAAYAARQRQREIGIRYALGATRPQVARQFLRRGLVVAVCGIVAGLLLTIFVSRYLANAVAGFEQHNVPAMLFAGVLFAAVALFANFVPAWRAANVAPMEVLRDE